MAESNNGDKLDPNNIKHVLINIPQIILECYGNGIDSICTC